MRSPKRNHSLGVNLLFWREAKAVQTIGVPGCGPSLTGDVQERSEPAKAHALSHARA